MTLAEKLTVLRKQQGLSQEDLASKLNLTRQAVHKWESGQSMPDIVNLQLLSDIFGVTLDSLVDDKIDLTPKNAPARASRGTVTDTGARLELDTADKQHKDYYPDDQKKLRTRKIVSLSAIALTVIGGVLSIAFALNNLFSLIPVGLVVLALGVVANIVAKFLFRGLLSANPKYTATYTASVTDLQNKGYTVIQIQYDMLAWFFFDEASKTVGIYFDGKEQLVCPIANLHRFEVRSNNDASVFFVNLVYADKDGKMGEYKFSLGCVRSYNLHEHKNKDAMMMDIMQLSKTTQSRLNQIKVKLDFLKNNG